MVSASLSVAQYRSPSGGCGHWAFHLIVTDGDTKEERILQIVDRSGTFKFEELSHVNPANSSRYIRSIHVMEVDGRQAIESVRKIVREQPILKQAQWSCQDWIIESLESLNLEGEIDDYDHEKVKDALQADYRDF